MKQEQEKFYFKILTLKSFYERLLSIIYDPAYKSKFYLELNQYVKWNSKDTKINFRGQIDIKCLDPSFGFKKLDAMNPHSIIIASGTLSPLDVFQEEIGLKCNKMTSAGYVITQDNIKARIVTKDIQGIPLKIDNPFFNT